MKNVIELNHHLSNIPIYFCYTNKAYEKLLKKRFELKNENIEFGGCCTVLEKKGSVTIVIGLKEYNAIYALKAMLVHEISHAVTKLMKELSIEDDEFRSYTLQWLYLEIMPFLDKALADEDIDAEAEESGGGLV